MRNWAVKRNVFGVFLCCRLAGNGMQRLVLRVMVLKLLLTGVMMDNHAERLTNTWVSAKLGLLSILCIQLGPWSCLLHIVAGCLLFSSCLSIEVNERAVETFRSVRCIMGVHCWGVSIKLSSTVLPCSEVGNKLENKGGAYVPPLLVASYRIVAVFSFKPPWLIAHKKSVFADTHPQIN